MTTEMISLCLGGKHLSLTKCFKAAALLSCLQVSLVLFKSPKSDLERLLVPRSSTCFSFLPCALSSQKKYSN